MKNKISILLIGIINLLIISNLYGQDYSDVRGTCKAEVNRSFNIKSGDKIEGEFGGGMEAHYYVIEAQPRQKIEIKAYPVGDNLNISVEVFDPGYQQFAGIRTKDGLKTTIRNGRSIEFETGVLSARGKYLVRVINYEWQPSCMLKPKLNRPGVYDIIISVK
jgi:hypothetical protein